MDYAKAINALQASPDDLVVVPDTLILTGEFPFMVHKVKFLNTPSIVRSRGFQSMSYMPSPTTGDPVSFAEWFGNIIQRQGGIPESPLPTDIGTRTGSLGEPVSVAKGEYIKEEKEDTTLPKFFRYARNLQMSKHFPEVAEFSPKGGVGFLFELDAANKTFAFSYALCHDEDNFDRAKARAILEHRFENEDWYEVKNYDFRFSLIDNVQAAITSLFTNQRTGLPAQEDDIQFSSLSERMKERELKQIFERI